MTMNIQNLKKPVIGISIGDINGIGPEIIIKALSDNRILEFCTPVIFGHAKILNFYKKSLPEYNFTFAPLKDVQHPNPKQINVLNCWDDEVPVTPGELNDAGGKYAAIALDKAVDCLKNKWIDGLVTAPIHKKNIQSNTFKHTGHTPYLQAAFAAKDVLMFMVADNLKVGLVTEHVPVKDVAQHITKAAIVSKLQLMNQSLKYDFDIAKPRIAVLALNPHAGDNGLIGKEEEALVKPAIKDAKMQNILAVGPYSADAFFARSSFQQFDGVLAMYHDQGLIPFKALATGEGTNYTAGLPIVRTSPDHGTAFDIAGKGLANHDSFVAAIFECITIINNRKEYDTSRANPLKKVSKNMLANVADERYELNL